MDNFNKTFLNYSLTIEKVLDFLHSKGLAVKHSSDNSALFNMNDEYYEIEVDGESNTFRFKKSYNLGANTSWIPLLIANNILMEERPCIKSLIPGIFDALRYCEVRDLIPEYDDDGYLIDEMPFEPILIFSFDYFCHSFYEFKTDFEWCIYALNDAIRTHRQIYDAIVSEPEEGKRK